MKNYIIPLLIALLLTASCKAKEEFIIEGHVPKEWNDEKVQLKNIEVDLFAGTIIDSAIIKNGMFKISGYVEKPQYVMLSFDNGHNTYLFLENFEIKVRIDNETTAVSGSFLNELYTIYQNGYTPLTVALQKISLEIVEARKANKDDDEFLQKKRAEMDNLVSEMIKYEKSFISMHANSLVVAYIVRMSKTGLDQSYVASVYNDFDDDIKNSPLGLSILSQITADRETAIGKLFPDIQMETPNNELISISDYLEKNKYILIDFWASWCGPCRHENYNLVKIDAMYRKKGLQIIGVSLDNNKENWMKAIVEDGITWPQISDLRGWNSSVIETYGIKGLPYTVLVNKEGVIIAKGLHGTILSDKLKELFL